MKGGADRPRCTPSFVGLLCCLSYLSARRERPQCDPGANTGNALLFVISSYNCTMEAWMLKWIDIVYISGRRTNCTWECGPRNEGPACNRAGEAPKVRLKGDILALPRSY